jgi:hypothetical protein
VDVHRGGAVLLFVKLRIEHIYNSLTETYQAAFFFQKTEPHNVIIKVRASELECISLKHPLTLSRRVHLFQHPHLLPSLIYPHHSWKNPRAEVGREKAERRTIRMLEQFMAARGGRRKADLELIVMMKRRRRRKRKRKKS